MWFEFKALSRSYYPTRRRGELNTRGMRGSYQVDLLPFRCMKRFRVSWTIFGGVSGLRQRGPEPRYSGAYSDELHTICWRALRTEYADIHGRSYDSSVVPQLQIPRVGYGVLSCGSKLGGYRRHARTVI